MALAEIIVFGDRIVDLLQIESLISLGKVLVQTFNDDVDILGKMEDAWTTFIETGRVWALLVGIFFGYLFKGLTSY